MAKTWKTQPDFMEFESVDGKKPTKNNVLIFNDFEQILKY